MPNFERRHSGHSITDRTPSNRHDITKIKRHFGGFWRHGTAQWIARYKSRRSRMGGVTLRKRYEALDRQAQRRKVAGDRVRALPHRDRAIAPGDEDRTHS